MGGFGRLVAVALFLYSTVAVGAGLPQETAERLENVVSLDETDSFVGAFHITISSVVQKPNGGSREESFIEAEIVHHIGGGVQRRLLEYLEDGSDVTEKKRADFESTDRPHENEDEGDENLADPFGDTMDRYRFGPLERRGSTTVITFEPASGSENDEDIARGAIAWDETTLEPEWLEMTAVHPPKPLKELRMRAEFVEVDGDLFVSRLVTDGLAKVLFFKREFHMEIRFDDIRPAAKTAKDSG